ncbi:sigma-70 family RNA polymerase sigma factor [Fulvivirgaceae bacterium BMA10]|uniref:Sigma-70 family RNA polymerase sigma factor n=1 Tax=Splendidivirga corallicola TaxID=3051826 RepID=A0ABT8KW54_9BACT|nr:sigma-70 family RNA polymerase sigma factor [Fulvivirgaceae bacterium BMA10]
MHKEEFIHQLKENEGIIYKVVSVYATNVEDRKDLYQEIVYQLWKSHPSFKHESKFSSWMYRVALNTSISQFKREQKRIEQVPIDTFLLNKMEQIDSLMEEEMTLLYAQIQKLSVIEKGIILLYLEGKSHDEIATITGFTPTNIGTRLSRIKIKLKSQLNTK